VLISDERLEQALRKLAQTDAKAAELHVEVERAEFRAKSIKDAIFLRTDGSVAERNALAGIDPEYAGAMQDYFNALQAHDTMRNERAREVIVIECWRSLNSARSKGLIT
jgi:hypothetical protein